MQLPLLSCFDLSDCCTGFNMLTEHFEEELPLLRPRLVGGPAGVGPPVTLSDVADG